MEVPEEYKRLIHFDASHQLKNFSETKRQNEIFVFFTFG